MQLAGQVAIITGASEGIGEALARLFVAEGARVALAARSEEKLEALARSLGGDRVLAIPTDVAEPSQGEHLVRETVGRFGRLDILVNNAGIGLYGLSEDMNWEHFRRLWEVNFFGAVRLTLAALPHLAEHRGAVVNISSMAGKIVLPYLNAYCSTKFALNAFSSGLRMEWARRGVRVVVVCPGRVQTRFHRSAFREGEKLPRIFQRRDISGVPPEHVARATLRALLWHQREVVVPWTHRLLAGLCTLLPGLAEWVLGRLVRREPARE